MINHIIPYYQLAQGAQYSVITNGQISVAFSMKLSHRLSKVKTPDILSILKILFAGLSIDKDAMKLL